MTLDAEMRAALDTFVEESAELLQDMEDGLLRLEQEPDSADTINAIFRAAHTIKGSSGLFGLTGIVGFTHVVESVLDALRDGKLAVSSALVAALLPCVDHIASLIGEIASTGQDAPSDHSTAERGEVLLAGLYPFLPGNSRAVTPHLDEGQTVSSGGGVATHGNWHISLRFGADSMRNGMDPLAFIRYLATLGDIVGIETIFDGIPEAALMDAETCYLGFEIELQSTATKESIENVFEFIRDDSVVRILPPHSQISEYIRLIQELPEDELLLGEILVRCGVLTRRELEEGLCSQHSGSIDSAAERPIGEILIDDKVVQEPIVRAALSKQKQSKESKAREAQSIRVDAQRLDRLIDLVGELVIAGAGANLRATISGDANSLEATAEVMRLVEEVRDSALQLRMVPIGTTFSRFQRVVRDMSVELGKEINLVISGGDTEVDKSVVEKIGDPLMHLVRNSMDHGIEAAETRRERGKPAAGTLQLNAFHDSGSIVIEVCDDGGGLNRERILAKAIERGLVAADAKLSDKEIYALIFEPGFSTAQAVSSLSGRGVGMDVVKRNITALRGVVDVESSPGLGSVIRMRLPLTLAIIDGFLVGVETSSFVVPLDRVIECVELPTDRRDHDYMNLRGQVLPFIRLRNVFEIGGQAPRRENVVVVEQAGIKSGIVVDHLMGEFQTVIKPLGAMFRRVDGIGGSTILGNGGVALIIDVPAFIRTYGERERARVRPALAESRS